MSKRFTYYGSLQSASPLLANLVAWYNFNNNVLDATPNAHNGTEVGTPSYLTGIIGNAINFQNDATLRYVTVPDSDDFSFTNGVNDLPFSISFWVQNLANSATGNWYVSKRTGTLTNAEYQIFRFTGSSQLVIALCSGGNFNNRIECLSTANPFALSTWAHIVFTYNGSGLASGLRIYVNGVNVTSSTATVGTYTGMSNTAANLGFGQALFSLINGLKHRGYMDLLGIWKNRELTLAEVNQLYNSGTGITYPF
jgi:hypothetical protein